MAKMPIHRQSCESLPVSGFYFCPQGETVGPVNKGDGTGGGLDGIRSVTFLPLNSSIRQ